MKTAMKADTGTIMRKAGFIKVLFLCTGLIPAVFASQDGGPSPVTGTAELGFLGVAGHRIQFSENNTYFDYSKDGGQDVLFPFGRLSLNWRVSGKHHVVFLYQPLSLVTRETLRRDLLVDGIRFPQGTPMEFRYDFPFWRMSYLYDFSKQPERELAFGLSIQIRNATIEFRPLDGSQFRSTRNIGPVPILKTRLRQSFSKGLWAGLEADGFYAPISYINGSDNEVVGAILDASGRAGLDLKKGSVFFNLRYLGGGAVGSSPNREGPGDGYVRNWLHFFTVGLGYSHPLF